ncbi:MAG: HigA family addiction module antidote protein [Thermoguttaceae bacterium]|nr:HigA family addiction module antidote protein [Thermoguttaceae bacterium]
MKRENVVCPGEILSEEFLKPAGISERRLALDLGVSAAQVSEIIAGNRAISEETALRLGAYFGVEPEFWRNLQTRFDRLTARNAVGGAASNV